MILGSPVAGVAETEVIDPTEAIHEINARFVGDPSLANLPRKFKSSISWLPDTPYESNDIALVGVIHPDHGPGFDLWVGGGLSTNPRLAGGSACGCRCPGPGLWLPCAQLRDTLPAAAYRPR